MLRAAPFLLLAVMLLPVAFGSGATLLPAFGHLPALGADGVSLDAWRAVLAWPGLGRSLCLTLGSGLAATSLSLASALALGALTRHARVLRLMQAAVAPVLATPHAALAIGFAFLAAPSGWVARLLSPWLTQWTVPPDIATVQDPYAIALVVGLWLKETPYLLLMTLAALAQADAPASRRVAASLGYGPWRAWVLVVVPRIWPQLRLPVMAVLAFSLSVVDVALILGPGNPPTLAVQVLRWLADPDLSRWFPGCAAAVLLCLVVGFSLVLFHAAECGLAALGRRVISGGARGGAGRMADAVASGLGVALGGAGAVSLVVLAVWSLTATWRFPAALPDRWTLTIWAGQGASLGEPAWATVEIGACATIVAVALCVACLENERRAGRPGGSAAWLLYTPLLVPQTAFLFGVQVALVRLRLDGTLFAVVWAHLVFVLPYVFLSLADPWRALDPRLVRSALCLGVPPWRVLLRVTLPLLARPLLAAVAVGFAVSAGLYLPTLFAGAGRIETLTTDAVTLASGGDRRVLAATALAQAAFPLAVFGLAVGVPAWRERRRAGLAL